MKGYSRTAIALHWLMGIPLIGLLLAGEQTMGSHDARFLPSVHASLGLALFVLFCVRLIWRFGHPPPPALGRNRLQTIAARLVHAILYVAMLLIPLTGWLAYTAHVRKSFGVPPASWFGMKIPLLPDFGINWHLVHNWGGKLLLVFIVLHILAALKHHFIDRDDTLRRMLR